MKFRWDLERKTTALTVLLLPALVWLGFWQLERADEKAQLAERFTQQSLIEPVALSSLRGLTGDDLRFRRVQLAGHFDSDVMLYLDNQVRNGRYGHDIYNLFYDRSSGFAALVNRGWIAGDPARQNLPEASIPQGELILSATVYVPPGDPYLLREDDLSSLAWPALVQSANTEALRDKIAELTGAAVFAAELRVEETSPYGFRADWPVVNVSPQKHQGYAVQWFTMAFALTLLFVVRSSNLLQVMRGGNQKL
ncbi:MAG: SURF1 family protein [Pseudomonadota bacterium]